MVVLLINEMLSLVLPSSTDETTKKYNLFFVHTFIKKERQSVVYIYIFFFKSNFLLQIAVKLSINEISWNVKSLFKCKIQSLVE
jgi:hypothetical protein